MSFGNLSPADRMKASGMIGLLVVLVFFIAHTVIGSVAAKKGGAPDMASATASAPPAPPAPNMPGAPASPDQAFPTKQVAELKSTGSAMDLDIHDPFVPIRNGDGTPAPRFGSKPQPATPNVAVKPLPPIPSFDPNRPVGNLSTREHFVGWDHPNTPAGPAGPAGTAGPAAVVIEPEIKLVGVVSGDPSVATLQVSGHIVIAKAGDAIAKRYTLQTISPEGVTIAHSGQSFTLHVGDTVADARR